MNGKRILFECAAQYHIISGGSQMDCLPNGTWVGEPMTCGGIYIFQGLLFTKYVEMQICDTFNVIYIYRIFKRKVSMKF